jgi:hypothetical protein
VKRKEEKMLLIHGGTAEKGSVGRVSITVKKNGYNG